MTPQDPAPRVLKLQMVASEAEAEQSFLEQFSHPNTISIYSAFNLQVGANCVVRVLETDRLLFAWKTIIIMIKFAHTLWDSAVRRTVAYLCKLRT